MHLFLCKLLYFFPKKGSSAPEIKVITYFQTFVGEGTGLVTKTTVTIGQDGQAHAESFIETFDMGKDLQEKVKRSRKSRERRSNRTNTKESQFQYDDNHYINNVNPQHFAPSAPQLNQMDSGPYGMLFAGFSAYRYRGCVVKQV